MPLQIVTTLGIIMLVFAVVLGIQTLVNKFSGSALDGFTTCIMVMLFIGSIVMISLGLIGYYLIRMYEEMKGRPRYIVTGGCWGKEAWVKSRGSFKTLLDGTFLRFVLVGVINTLFGTAIMFLLYNLLLGDFSWGYWVSSAANYLFGSILSYFLNKKFTFRNKERGIRPVLRFTANIAACYLVAYGLAKPAVRLILTGFDQKLQENLAMLAGMALFVLMNYLGQRFFAFRKRSTTDNTDGLPEKKG